MADSDSGLPAEFSSGPARAEARVRHRRIYLSHYSTPPLPFWPWRVLCPGPCATAPSHPFSFPNRPGRHAACLLPQMVAMTMALLLLLPRLASQSSSRTYNVVSTFLPLLHPAAFFRSRARAQRPPTQHAVGVAGVCARLRDGIHRARREETSSDVAACLAVRPR